MYGVRKVLYLPYAQPKACCNRETTEQYLYMHGSMDFTEYSTSSVTSHYDPPRRGSFFPLYDKRRGSIAAAYL